MNTADCNSSFISVGWMHVDQDIFVGWMHVDQDISVGWMHVDQDIHELV